ncbi:MAG: competence/damage-inducible protein A [Rhodospirillaceae bacterium]|nr:competence/damage-inducible protein A [Rhodospirillaceae bacterium]
MSETSSPAPTACILVIGDEILSGRTQDTNIKYMATRLGQLGIKLREARVVPDQPEAIVAAVNFCRVLYTYVFTTGGIGPTHDDITTACIAKAFGRKVIRHPDAEKKLRAFYKDSFSRGGGDVNEARLKMAETPDGDSVTLIENLVTSAPGYRIENVFVMAGVPSIAQAMFEAAVPLLRKGDPVFSGSVDGEVREGDIAADLTALQEKYAGVSLGSYPSVRDNRLYTSIVARATDKTLIALALAEVADMMRKFGADPTVTAP